MNIEQIVKTSKAFLTRNSSTILTCASVCGVISTVVMASQATIKAQDILRDEPRDLKVKEQAKLTWKCYIPTAISAGLTIGCIIGSHNCSLKQKEALSSAYLLSQTTLHEYQKKVVEKIGQNKEKAIYQETVKEIADKRAPITQTALISSGVEAIETGHGNTLFYDVPGDIYFKSEINYLKSSVNDLNHELLSEMEFDWNELYYRWGLPHKKYGSEMIFDIDRPLDLKLEPELMENGQVRILVDYDLYPKCVGR